MKNKYSFDPRCLDLAEYFLGSGHPKAWTLAQELQDCIEDFDAPSLAGLPITVIVDPKMHFSSGQKPEQNVTITGLAPLNGESRDG